MNILSSWGVPSPKGTIDRANIRAYLWSYRLSNPNPQAPVSVALVEDDPGMRERFERVIAAEPSLRLAFGASTAGELLTWFASHPVDVLLVDLGLPDRSGLEVIRRCRDLQPACAMMVLTIFGDEVNMLRAFEAGAGGYLLKDGTEADLAAHVLSLHAGGSPMSPIIARQLLVQWQARPASATAEVAPGREALSPTCGPGRGDLGRLFIGTLGYGKCRHCRATPGGPPSAERQSATKLTQMCPLCVPKPCRKAYSNG